MSSNDPILSALEAKIAALESHPADFRSIIKSGTPELRWELQVAEYELHSTRDFDALKIAALGGTVDAEAAISLSGLYVDPAAETGEFHAALRNEDGSVLGLYRTTRHSDSILTAIRSAEHPRHIILGGAGMGKSSVLRCLYLSWALRDSASGARLRAIVAGASRPQASHESGDLTESLEHSAMPSARDNEATDRSGAFLSPVATSAASAGAATRPSGLRKAPLLGAQRLADDGGGTPPLPVPILVEIREFLGARGRAVDGVDHKPVENILGFLTQKCGRAWCFDRAALLAALDEGRAWLLVDGLDEAFDPAERKRIGDWLRGFSIQHPKARIIASSRVIGFVEHEWARRGVDHREPTWEMHTLVPFDEGRIATFLDHWFRAEGSGTFVRVTKREEVAQAIASRPFLKPLAEVPLTLTMICAVGQRGIQPDNRHAVFYEAAKIFIQQWDNARGLPKDKARIVERWREYGETGRMAFFRTVAMKLVEGVNPNDSNRISRDDLRAVLVKKFTDAKDPNAEPLADEILSLICERNFLLTELGSGSYAFFHRAFLEYFTALGWADRFQNFAYVGPVGFFEKVIRPRVADGTWHDTLRFLFGVLPTVPAQRCLLAMWAMKAEQVPERKEQGLWKDGDRIWVARVLAAELAAEVRPYSPEDGESISPQSIAKDWRRELVEFTGTENSWGGKEGALRERAMMAVAVLWAGDDAAGMELARLLIARRMGGGSLFPLGQALAAGWPGRSRVYALVRDVALGPDAAKVVSDFSRHGVPSRETVHPSRQQGLRENDPALASEGLPTKVEDYSAPRTPPDVLAPFFNVKFVNEVRQRAVHTLAFGWLAEPEVRVVITGLAQDVSERAQVRGAAVYALADGWPAEPEVRAALAALAQDASDNAVVREAAASRLGRLPQ